MKHHLLLAALLILQLSCSDSGTGPDGRRLNLLFNYGPGGRSQLNTFNDTVTKDLGGSTSTGRLVLSRADLDSIESRLRRIGIFSYPDTFIAGRTDTIAAVVPYETYSLKLNLDSRWKSLFWRDSFISPDPRAVELREVLTFIRLTVEAYPEYKTLGPEVKYL